MSSAVIFTGWRVLSSMGVLPYTNWLAGLTRRGWRHYRRCGRRCRPSRRRFSGGRRREGGDPYALRVRMTIAGIWGPGPGVGAAATAARVLDLIPILIIVICIPPRYRGAF